jgi:hypothetical protein
MISKRNSLGRCLPPMLGVLILCLTPLTGNAQTTPNAQKTQNPQTVMLRNECRSPVVVQVTMVDKKGVIRREEPMLLRYGDCTERIKTDVDKVITIVDNKSNRVLFRDVLKANKKERYFSIIFDPRMPGRVQLVLRPTKTEPPMKPKSN